MTAGAIVRHHRGSAREFHERDLEPELAVHVVEIEQPALVIGSTQPMTSIDRTACEGAGVDVVRRRSGGGAVLLRPGESGWLDVVVPRDGPGWATDLMTPMIWLGEHIRSVIGPVIGPVVDEHFDAAAGAGEPTGLLVHRGGLVSTPWSRAVCFDGLGAGEIITAGSDRAADPSARPAKVLGMSQRRTREAARLQCLWFRRHRYDELLRLLAGPTPDPDQLQRVQTMPNVDAASLGPRLADHLGAAIAPGNTGEAGEAGEPRGDDGG